MGGVVVAVFAVAADLIEVDGRPFIEPATVLTVALVAATIFYALQTLDMAAQKSPIRAWIGPKMAKLVPHTGFPTKRLMRLSRVRPVPRRDT